MEHATGALTPDFTPRPWLAALPAGAGAACVGLGAPRVEDGGRSRSRRTLRAAVRRLLRGGSKVAHVGEVGGAPGIVATGRTGSIVWGVAESGHDICNFGLGHHAASDGWRLSRRTVLHVAPGKDGPEDGGRRDRDVACPSFPGRQAVREDEPGVWAATDVPASDPTSLDGPPGLRHARARTPSRLGQVPAQVGPARRAPRRLLPMLLHRLPHVACRGRGDPPGPPGRPAGAVPAATRSVRHRPSGAPDGGRTSGSRRSIAAPLPPRRGPHSPRRRARPSRDRLTGAPPSADACTDSQVAKVHTARPGRVTDRGRRNAHARSQPR